MKKKILATAVAMLSVLALAGCKKNNQNTSENPSELPEYDIVSMNMDDYMILGEYKGIEINYDIIEVTEESVQEQKDLMVEVKGDKIGLKEGEAKEGDKINFDYEGKLDGVPFDRGSAQNQTTIIGKGGFIPGFEDALIGMKPGEVKDAPVTFPEDYGDKELAGKEAVFTMTLNYIYPDEITDEIVAAMGEDDYSTVEEFDAFARDVLTRQAEENNRTNIIGLGMEKILTTSAFGEIPAVIRENQRQELEVRYADAIQGGAYDLETVIQYLYGCSADELIDRYCRQRMAIQAIAKAEGITATDEEVDARLNEVSKAWGMTPEEYMAVNSTTRNKLKELLISEKVQNFIHDNVKIVPYN